MHKQNSTKATQASPAHFTADPAVVFQHPSAKVQLMDPKDFFQVPPPDPREQRVKPDKPGPHPPVNLFPITSQTLAAGRAERMDVLERLLVVGDGKGVAVALARYHAEDPDGFPFPTLMAWLRAIVQIHQWEQSVERWRQGVQSNAE